MALTPPITFDQSTYLEGLYGPSNISPVLPVTYNPITYDLGVNSATSATSGIVSAGAQNFGGDKTFDDDVTVTGSLNLSSVDLTSISHPQLTIGYDSTNNATLGVDSAGKLMIDSSGDEITTSDVVKVTNASAATSTTTGALIDSGGLAVAKELWVGNGGHFANSGTQLTLANELAETNKTTLSVSATGDLTIDTSGNDINLASTDKVHVLNVTEVGSSTAALTVDGGLFTSKGVEVTGHTLSQSGAIVANKFSTALMHMTYRVSTDADVAILPTATLTGTCAITNGKLDLTGGSNQYLRYDGTTNLATLTDIGTVRFKYTPNYSGTPAATQNIFGCGNGIDGVMLMVCQHRNDGLLGILIRDTIGTFVTSPAQAWNPTASVEYDIEINFDIIVGIVRLFVNGSLLREYTWVPSHTRAAAPYCYVGADPSTPGTCTSNFSIRDLIILPSVVNTGAYGSAWYSPGIDVSGVAISRALLNTGRATISGSTKLLDSLYVSNGGHFVNSGTQLTLANEVAETNKVTFSTSDTGDLTIDASGNDINFHSTDTVKVLNTTASTSPTTGGFITSGGVGVAGASWVGGGGHFTNTGTQLTLANEAAETNKVTFSTSATGDLTIDASGNDINMASTDKVHVLNVTEVGSSTAALTVDGGLFTSKGVEVTGHTLSQSGAIVANKFSTALMHMTYRVSTDADIATLPTPTAVGACVITNGKLDLTGGSNQYLRYDGTTNLATLTNIATVRCKYTPNYSGTPATVQFIVGCGNGNNYNNYFDFVHNTSNGLGATMRTGDGSVIVTGGGAWNPPPVAGTEYDIELGIDVINGSFRIFLNGTLLRNQIWEPTGTTRDASPYCYVGTNAAFPSGQAPNFSIRDLIILPSVVNTGAYGSAWYSPGIDVSGVAISRALLNTGRATISGSTKLLDSLYVSNGGHFANSGTQLTLANEEAETNTGTLSVDGGGILTIDSSGSQITTPDVVKITNATNSTSTSTGALQVSGGASVVNDLYVGGTIHGSISSTSTISDIGHFKEAYVGQDEAILSFNCTYFKYLRPDIASVKTYVSVGDLAISNHSLALLGGASAKYVTYDASTNLSSVVNTGTYRISYTPAYSGTPATTQYLLTSGVDATMVNLVRLFHTDAGVLNFIVVDSTGVSSIRSFGSWAPVSGTMYEIEASFDTTTGKTYLFVDGTLVASDTDASIVRDATSNVLVIGAPSHDLGGTDYANFSVSNLKIFPIVIHTETYVVEALGSNVDLVSNGLTNAGELMTLGNATIGGTLNSGTHVITNAGSQLRLNYEEAGTNYASFSADSSGLSMGTSGGITSCSDVFNFTDTTDSSSTITGGIVSSGGLGLAKSLNVGGVTHITNTTDSTSSTTGSVKIDGGLGVAKRATIGTTLNFPNEAASKRVVLYDTGTDCQWTGSTYDSDQYHHLQIADTEDYFTFNAGTGSTTESMLTHISGDVTNGSFKDYHTLDASNYYTAGAVFDGGVGIAKKLIVHGTASFAGAVTSGGDNVVVTTSTTANATFAGPWAADQTKVISYVTLDDLVICTIPFISVTGSVASTAIAASGTIPEALRPAYSVAKTIIVTVGGVSNYGTVVIDSDGKITIGVTKNFNIIGDTFATGGAVGWPTFTVEWKLD